MAKVVMLTGLAGPGCDIVPGDICECSAAQAVRFEAMGYARPVTDADKHRVVKQLPEPSSEAKKPSEPQNKDAPNEGGTKGKAANESQTRKTRRTTRKKA